MTRHFLALVLSLCMVVGFAASEAIAGVRVSTNLSTQTMTVSVNGAGPASLAHLVGAQGLPHADGLLPAGPHVPRVLQPQV